jgi:hypothetical protein
LDEVSKFFREVLQSMALPEFLLLPVLEKLVRRVILPVLRKLVLFWLRHPTWERKLS